MAPVSARIPTPVQATADTQRVAVEMIESPRVSTDTPSLVTQIERISVQSSAPTKHRSRGRELRQNLRSLRSIVQWLCGERKRTQPGPNTSIVARSNVVLIRPVTATGDD